MLCFALSDEKTISLVNGVEMFLVRSVKRLSAMVVG
jgi:hypothetical protein